MDLLWGEGDRETVFKCTHTHTQLWSLIPEVDLACIVIAVEHEPPELFIDHIDHCREWEPPREGSLGQRRVLVGEDLYNSLKLLVGRHFKLIVVIVFKDVPIEYVRVVNDIGHSRWMELTYEKEPPHAIISSSSYCSLLTNTQSNLI